MVRLRTSRALDGDVLASDTTMSPLRCLVIDHSLARWRGRIDVRRRALGVRVVLCAEPVRDDLGDGRDDELRSVRFEAAIAPPDAEVSAFAALAERWLAERCAPEEHARITAWVRKSVALEPRSRGLHAAEGDRCFV